MDIIRYRDSANAAFVVAYIRTLQSSANIDFAPYIFSRMKNLFNCDTALSRKNGNNNIP